jgi:hypothetical protein
MTAAQRRGGPGLIAMRFPLVAVALLAALGLAGCQFKTVADPSLNKRDSEWMALTP